MRTIFTPIFFLLSATSFAQTDIRDLLNTSNTPPSLEAKATEQFSSLMEPFSSAPVSEKKLLRKVFHRIQNSMLKEYTAYADFSEIFTEGKYDCLTATALFSQALDHLKFSYEIIETNYHIFLMVKTPEGDVLLETTDRFNGFVTEREEIEKRIGRYKNLEIRNDNSKKYVFTYSFSLYQQIAPENLSGLLFFNQAVKAYNRGNWSESSKFLAKANSIYPSPRCQELGLVLVRTVMESKLNEQAKADCLTYLKNF